MIGKIFGSAVGAIFGFPGLVLGLMAGHYADVRLSRNNQDFLRDAHAAGINIGGNMDQVAFTVGIVVLGAKMAKVDGKVTRSEIEAFKRVFQIPSQHEAQIGALFDQARQDAAGYEAYAAQLARLFHARPAVLEELLTGLMLIAAADAGIVPEEERFLRDVARIFGFSPYEFSLIAARSGAFPGHRQRQKPGRPSAEAVDDPYRILGVTPASTPAAVKAAYRRLIVEHHPDKLVAAGMAAEFVSVATEKMKRINAAYDQICKARGMT